MANNEQLLAKFENISDKPKYFNCKFHRIPIMKGVMYNNSSYFTYYCDIKCKEDYEKFSLRPTKFKSKCKYCWKEYSKLRVIKYVFIPHYLKNSTKDFVSNPENLKRRKNIDIKGANGIDGTITIHDTAICSNCLGDRPLNTVFNIHQDVLYTGVKEEFVKFTCAGCKKKQVKEDIVQIVKNGRGPFVCDETCANIYILRKTI